MAERFKEKKKEKTSNLSTSLPLPSPFPASTASTHQDEHLRADPSELGELIEEAKTSHLAVIEVFDGLLGVKTGMEGIERIGGEEKAKGGGGDEGVLLELQGKTEVLRECLALLSQGGE